MSDGDHDLRPFAWAGLALRVPNRFRLFRAEAGYRKGSLGFGDGGEPRLEIAWGQSRPGGDAQRRLSEQLLRRRRGRRRGEAREEMESWSHPQLSPLLRLSERGRGVDRVLGYAPETGRFVEVILHTSESPQRDAALFRAVVGSLRDQPPDAAHPWAFFGHRLTTPPGFHGEESQLRVGDMALWLRRRDSPRHGRLAMQLIYPARLATQRQTLEMWMVRLHHNDRTLGHSLYLQPGNRKRIHTVPRETVRGPGHFCDAELRGPVRLVRWGLPRWQRHALIHDEEADRLISLRLADAPERFEAVFDAVLSGLDWPDEKDPSFHDEGPSGG